LINVIAAKNNEPQQFSPLENLIVDGMDLEQIWQQINLEV
jgi:hypothetical protein